MSISRQFEPAARRRFIATLGVIVTFTLGGGSAHAQGRDGLLNGTIIGAAAGAGAGMAFTYAVRDSELTASQYAQGALIFGAIGAGAGLGLDALLNRAPQAPGVPSRRVLIVPTVWHRLAGVVVKWRW